MKLSIKGQGQSLTLVKGQSDFKVKCLTFGLYTQVSNSGPHGPLVSGIFGLGGVNEGPPVIIRMTTGISTCNVCEYLYP